MEFLAKAICSFPSAQKLLRPKCCCPTPFREIGVDRRVELMSEVFRNYSSILLQFSAISLSLSPPLSVSISFFQHSDPQSPAPLPHITFVPWFGHPPRIADVQTFLCVSLPTVAQTPAHRHRHPPLFSSRPVDPTHTFICLPRVGCFISTPQLGQFMKLNEMRGPAVVSQPVLNSGVSLCWPGLLRASLGSDGHLGSSARRTPPWWTLQDPAGAREDPGT